MAARHSDQDDHLRIEAADLRELVRLRGLADSTRFREAVHILNHRLLAGAEIDPEVPIDLLRRALATPRPRSRSRRIGDADQA